MACCLSLGLLIFKIQTPNMLMVYGHSTTLYNALMSTSKRIGSLLISPATGLHTILEKAAILQQLTQTLRSSLSEPLNQHICVANIRNNTLVIGADSPAWVTRIRFHSADILKQMRQETGLTQLSKVHFKVIRSSTQGSDFVSSPNSLPESAASLLQSTAQRISDKELKAAIERLSRNRP